MTREQQWVVLFLSLTLSFFFFLTAPPSVLNQAIRDTVGGDPPSPKSIAGEFLVEVDGSVNRRGVYAIRAGMNILEVIEKAGGISGELFLPPESLGVKIEKNCRLNILPVEEGKGRVLLEPLNPQKLKVLSIPININIASVEELDILPGIGPRTAEEIVEYRKAYGKFSSPEDLLHVRGMGPKKLAAILPHITIRDRP